MWSFRSKISYFIAIDDDDIQQEMPQRLATLGISALCTVMTSQLIVIIYPVHKMIIHIHESKKDSSFRAGSPNIAREVRELVAVSAGRLPSLLTVFRPFETVVMERTIFWSL